MEKILIPYRKGFKANLHSHSTDSDGKLTPEQMKKLYKDNGYSVLAYTDHVYMRDRTSLTDENFVAISGYENYILDWDFDDPEMSKKVNPLECKCYHLNFYSPRPDKVGMVGIRKYFYDYYYKVYKGGKTPEEIAASPVIGDFIPDAYSKAVAQQCIDDAAKQGYLVVFNHPVWSRQDDSDYLGLKGLTGMEIYNWGGIRGGFEDEASYIYDLMLRDGQRIACFANDDNHNHVEGESFGGYNILYADKLDYEHIFNAIKNGDGYASSGAEIKGMAYKDGKLYVSTENAAYIRLTTNGRYAAIERMKTEPLKEAVFDVSDEFIKYFRITVRDTQGGKAYTRGYFTDEIK